jgi:hypothetical protein
MARLVHLDNVEHAALKLADGWTSDASVNVALVAPTEFEQVQREYPIMFRREGDREFQAIAILGLKRGENLYLSGHEWNARYVPATLRRGPFFLDASGDGEPAVLVDLDDPRVGEVGEPLFLPHGGAAPPLQDAAEALRTIHQGLAFSERMFAAFLDHGLIAPMEIEVDVGDGTQYRLNEFFNISAEALAELSGEALEQLNRSGFLACAIHARSSLGNVGRLVELMATQADCTSDA